MRIVEPESPWMPDLARLVLDRRLAAAAVAALLTVAAGWGHLARSPRFADDRDARSDGELAVYHGMRRSFDASEGEYLLLVDGADLFTPGATAALRELAARLAELEFVELALVPQALPAPVARLLGLPELPDASAGPEAWEAAREAYLAHPLVGGQLVAPSGRLQLVPLAFGAAGGRVDRELQPVRGVVDEALAGSGLRARHTGETPLLLAQRAAFERDHARLRLWAYALVLVLAVALFRGLVPVLLVSIPPALGVAWTQGAALWLEIPGQNLTRIVMPVLLLMVGFTDGVHLLVRLRTELAAGRAPREAAETTLRAIGPACALTSLTTAIGFASLSLAHSELIRNFGVVCALGVGFTFLAVVVLIPLVGSTPLGARLGRAGERDLVERLVLRSEGLLTRVLRHRTAVSVAGVAATLGFLALGTRLAPDNRIAADLPAGSEARRALEDADRELGGVQPVHVWVAASSPDVGTGELLAGVEAAARVLASEPRIAGPLSVLDVADALGEAATAADLVERRGVFGLLPAWALDRFLPNGDGRGALVHGRVADLGIARLDGAFRSVERRLGELERDHPGLAFRLTGLPVVEGRNRQRLMRDLLTSLGVASLSIFVVLGLALRSLRLGLISVVPNVFPLAVTAGVLALTHPYLEFASVCAFTICLGIAVDDTIHFLARYRTERRAGLDVEPALHVAFRRVGTALVLTTLVMVSGDALILTSELPEIRVFGALACATLLAALPGDLLLLPALLARFDRRADRAR